MVFQQSRTACFRTAACRRQTVVLVGHGSAFANSGNALFRNVAHRLQRRHGLGETFCAFAHTPPSLGDVLARIGPAGATVVPVLGMVGHHARRIVADTEAAARSGCRVRLTPVLGTHRPFVAALAERVLDLMDATPLRCSEAGLLLIGHGSRSRGAPEAASLLGSLLCGAFAETATVCLSREPAVSAWPSLLRARDVVAIPMLFSDGRHMQMDVGAAIGLPRDRRLGRRCLSGPWIAAGRRIWCADILSDAAFLAASIAELLGEVVPAHRPSLVPGSG